MKNILKFKDYFTFRGSLILEFARIAESDESQTSASIDAAVREVSRYNDHIPTLWVKKAVEHMVAEKWGTLVDNGKGFDTSGLGLHVASRIRHERENRVWTWIKINWLAFLAFILSLILGYLEIYKFFSKDS